ncbi:MAG: tetratricopeptide repeat protein [Sulfuricellaceae bacterium]
MSAIPNIIPPRHPWLDRLAAEPERALDALLRGVAHLPGLQRASPGEALMALLGDLPPEAAEWGLLDRALLVWLQARRQAVDGLLGRPGGVERFIRETGEAFRAAWRLKLPESCAWIRAEAFDLLRWADGFSLDATFDLGRAVLTAAAHVQQGGEYRFLWLRICEEAAAPRLRHRLDAALLGLARTPGAQAGAPSHDLIVGLARWGARLPSDDNAKSEMVREWRALKAAFPRQPGFWRGQWEAVLADERIGAHPFTHWLREADPALQAPSKTGQVRRTPQLPKDISGSIKEMDRECRAQGLTAPLWQKMAALLSQVEDYADATGESYYLVTSCTNIAKIILNQAPGQALTLTRRALLWTPSDGHAWSTRATALDRLGRPDLAEAVLWEAIRRVPSNIALYNDLALAWVERGGLAEAEALLRKAAALDPNDGPTFVELARVLWLLGRADDALALLRDFLRRTNDAIALYTFGCLLVAEGRSAAAEVLEQYRRAYGNDHWAATLQRLIAAGTAGQEESRQHLREPRRRGGLTQGVPWDAESAERALAAEQAGFPRLEKIERVAQADLLFRLGDARRADALRLVDTALTDPADAYAQVVKGLAAPEYRVEMIGRTGRFAGSLPVRLALTPDNAGAEHWHDLLRRFPEGGHLTRLVQLARGAVGEESDTVHAALAAWCSEPTHWANGWDKHLKETLRRHLDGDDIPVSLATLAHDALTQAVDVGQDAVPLAA